MKNKIISAALVGNTNVGKSTIINSIIGKKISIENKKINTTLDIVEGILIINNTQIIFYDTPGSNFFKTHNITQRKQNTQLWEIMNQVDKIFYIIDSLKFNYDNIVKDIKKIKESKKSIIVIFNKVDLINKEKILLYISKLNQTCLIDDFFNISAKYNKGLSLIKKYLIEKSKYGKWLYSSNKFSENKNITITNECTRNALLNYLHQEIPYNIIVKNKLFKLINKNNIKIKQSIEINNIRYKSIILGKEGRTIKMIRKSSQEEIEDIFNKKIHLYIEVVYLNAK